MNIENLIPLEQLCTHYKIEQTFFEGLEDFGLIEVTRMEASKCIHVDHIHKVEKIIRLHHDLDLNYAGIDTVMNLLERIDRLNQELLKTKSRLLIYEDRS